MKPDFRIAIIGAGFGGLGMAIRLKQEGYSDYQVFEKADDVGGTWRANTYPGCACDVESPLYSFSFFPNPNWSRLYSGQPEIWDYLRKCANHFGVIEKIKFNQEVQSLEWLDEKKLWRIQTNSGTYHSQIVVAAPGPLSVPALPDIKGIKNFKGRIFHSAQWDHSFDLTGKNVAVIGTGASAIQFVPEIQPKVGKLYLFQRTAPWVLPRPDRKISEREKVRFQKHPFFQKLQRARIYGFREGLGFALRSSRLGFLYRKMAIHNIKKHIKDPELVAKLTPNYEVGCKRVLLANNYYPSVAQKNVDVITEGIDEIGETFVKTKDGKNRDVDAIILGTGFQVTEMPFSKVVKSPMGKLSEIWNGSPFAHLGITVHGYPNLFMLLGPSTGLGHSSVVLMIESQISHILGAIAYMDKNHVASVEPKLEAQNQYLSDVLKKMKKTVWITGGCVSWYLDKDGKNSTLWPGSCPAYDRRVRNFESNEYRFKPFPARPAKLRGAEQSL